jgi:hypothetical protein
MKSICIAEDDVYKICIFILKRMTGGLLLIYLKKFSYITDII